MARNRHGVIWTRIAGQPEKMGDLVVGDETIAFTYTPEYLESGRPGFCLLGDGALWGRESVTYPISERIPVFPRLLALIPGGNPRNLQRRHYLDMLRAQQGREPPPGPDTEWLLLTLGGHGGIGHIDLFADDLAAERWYQDTSSGRDELLVRPSGSRSQLWRMIKRNVLDENLEFDPGIVEATLGPTPSVAGMIPKLLVSMDPDSEQVEFFPPDTPGKRDLVLKIEPPEYAGLLDLEELCLELHRCAGFQVPWSHRYDSDGLRFLAIERFDRRDGLPLPMESLFSIIATGDHQFRENGDLLLDELGGILARLKEVANLAPDTGETLYRRLLMALLTGNGDLHLDNLALIGGLEDCRLSPIYDPAPMRAWPRHNLISAIPYDPADYPDQGLLFRALGPTFGLNRKQTRTCIDDALALTADYGEQVMALEGVPERQRRQLVEICDRERGVLRGAR
jgi:serine/threonine-protein kinase HipA